MLSRCPAEWTSGGEPKSAIPRPGSAQELFARLAAAAGLDDDLVNLGYDAAAKALTFHLSPETPFDPVGVGVDANIGDLLRNQTNLAGLKEATGNLSADVDDIDFDVTFGVLLNASTSDITPIRGTAESGGAGTFTDDEAREAAWSEWHASCRALRAALAAGSSQPALPREDTGDEHE